MNSHRLFGEAAQRYDLHTPPRHYQHDHAFVLDELRRFAPGPKILDVGCGTGVFLELARTARLDAVGIDSSLGMVAVAEARLGPGVVKVQDVQSLDDDGLYDAIVALSWSFNYCRSQLEAADVMGRFFHALRPGGLLIIQTAHSPNASGHLHEDREPGPNGEPDDVQFLYRFMPIPGAEPQLLAQYVYSCRSLNELVAEEHVLSATDADLIARLARAAGFEKGRTYENWRREEFVSSVSPFVLAQRPAPPERPH